MRTEQLKQDFRSLCDELRDRPGVLHTTYAEGPKEAVFSIFLYAIKVELVYCWKWENIAPPSVLYCRFYLSKNDHIYFHLPELISHLGTADYRACYFPYIENTQRMEACFQALTSIVDDYIPAVEALARSQQSEQLLRNWYRSNFFDINEEPTSTLDFDNVYEREYMVMINRCFESLMVGRHSNLDAYEAFLLGDWDKALKKYSNMNKSGLSAYELGLCRFMENPDNRDFLPIPPECMNLREYRKFIGVKNALLGMTMLWIPSAMVLCGIIAVVNAVLARDTVFFFGTPVWFGMIMAVFPAVFGYEVLEHRILRFLRRKQELDFLSMMDNHPIVSKLAIIILTASIVGSIGLCLWLPQFSFCFYDTYAECTMEKSGELRFEYADVANIYYIHCRYNGYGGRVKRGSYVIVLKDDTCIDLDSAAGKQAQEELIQTLFAEFDIIEVDSDRELPNEESTQKT